MQLSTVLLDEVDDPESSVRELPESIMHPTADHPAGSDAVGNGVGLAVDGVVGDPAFGALNTLSRQFPPQNAHVSPLHGV